MQVPLNSLAKRAAAAAALKQANVLRGGEKTGDGARSTDADTVGGRGTGSSATDTAAGGGGKGSGGDAAADTAAERRAASAASGGAKTAVSETEMQG